MMMRQVVTINWRYAGDAVPAFVTLIFIPFGYSAAYGLIAGLLVYTSLNGMIYLTKLLSCGRFVPDDEDQREYWTSMASCNGTQEPRLTLRTVKPQGKLPWFITASQSIADRLAGSNKNEDGSLRSGDSTGTWSHTRIESKASERELSTFVAPDSKAEKILGRM
jgi:AGZA family xanthine/uracil permease-like MFS transporter